LEQRKHKFSELEISFASASPEDDLKLSRRLKAWTSSRVVSHGYYLFSHTADRPRALHHQDLKLFPNTSTEKIQNP
jgi:hypothetical protein